MIFWNIVIGIAMFFLNLVLAPKPQNAKAASLEDFDLPVAEEGLEIPVLFGTTTQKAPNCVWYGDFAADAIKGPRRYMFFGPRQVIGHKYKLGMHMVLCHGVHDTVLSIWAGDKDLQASIAGSGSISINKPDLFGGEDGEGGIQGTIDIMSGSPSQGQNDYLASKLEGATTPAFRGIVSVVWRHIYIGTNAYIKPWEFTLQRILKTSAGIEQWYSGKAAINVMGDSAKGYDMNPAHIIRECLTDTTWGMGYPAGDIDDTSFMAAADVLFAEGFGMSLLWTREERIEEFITVVLSHIDAYLYLKRTTGKFYLKLIRYDYDLGSLPIFGEDDVVKWDEVTRREPAESNNSVIVKYTDRSNRGKDASLSYDNIAQIQQLGTRVSATRFYPGVSTSGLASRLASRDQKSLGIGLISGRVTGTRKWDILYPGDPFRLVTARHNLDGEVMRVASMRFGDGRENRISVKFGQDVFNLSPNELVDVEDTDWESPSNPPAAVDIRLVWEMPYRELREMIGSAQIDTMLSSNPTSGMIQASGQQPTPDSTEAYIYVDGIKYETMSFAPSGLLDVSIDEFDTEVVLTSDDDLDLIVVPILAAIHDDLDPLTTEIVWVTAVVGTTLTISRGMLDTVPRAHVAGETLVVYDTEGMPDGVQRADATTPDVQLLTRSTQGVLDIGVAPVEEITMDSRAIRPLRPANVRVNGQSIGPVDALLAPTLSVTWVERNRLTEISTPLTWTDATTTPEAGQTTIIEVTRADGLILTTHAGLTGTSYSVPATSFGAYSNGYIRVGSERDGYREWQAYQIECRIGGDVLVYVTSPSMYARVNGVNLPTDAGYAVGEQLTMSVGSVTVIEGIGDLYWLNVKFLAGFNGVDGATSSVDESIPPHSPLTFVGDAQIDTAEFKFGVSSLKLDGTGDYVTVPDSTDWDLSNANSDQFTIEAWVRRTVVGSVDRTIVSQNGSGSQAAFTLKIPNVANSTELNFGLSNSGSSFNVSITTSGAGIVTNAWHHVAVDKDATGKIRVYANGVMCGSSTPANSAMFNATTPFAVGSDSTGGRYWQGWIDEVRITKGVARYASDAGYTVPITPFARFGTPISVSVPASAGLIMTAGVGTVTVTT
jgi:hypothetical protein